MRWPFTSPPTQGPVPSVPRSQRVEGEARELSSPGLRELLASVPPRSQCRALDLGAASPGSLEVLSRHASTVRFVDVLRPGRSEGQLSGSGIALLGCVPAAVLPAGETFDLILVWDVLAYLSVQASTHLVGRLCSAASPGAKLYTVLPDTPTMPAHPSRFEIAGDGSVLCHPLGTESIPSPRRPPAEVERILQPFKVQRSFVLRHGVREYVACLASVEQRETQ